MLSRRCSDDVATVDGVRNELVTDGVGLQVVDGKRRSEA